MNLLKDFTKNSENTLCQTTHVVITEGTDIISHFEYMENSLHKIVFMSYISYLSFNVFLMKFDSYFETQHVT